MNRGKRIESLLKALSSAPGDVFYNYALGLEYAADPSTALLAEEQFKTTIRLDPANVPAHFQLGKLKERLGETGEALEWLRKGLQHAREQNERKAAGEIEQAIFLLEE